MKLPNGFGSIHKLSGNRRNPWRVRKTIGKTPDGKTVYANVGYYESRAEAFKSLSEYNSNPWDIQSKAVTLDDIYQLILKQKEKEVTPASFKILRSVYNHVEPLKNFPVSEIKTNAMQHLLDGLDKSPVIKRKVKGVFTDVFKYALKNDIVKKDYASLVEVGKPVTEKKKIEIFTNDEIRTISKSDGFYHELTLILICTGFRINELLGLETSDINLENGTFTGGSKTEAGKNRVVPISRHILPLIEKHYDTEKPYLFVNARGKKHNADNLRRKWNEVYTDHHFHECRHTFSSICNNADMQKLAQQRILGHTPKDITDRVYTHKTVDDLKREMEKFDAYLDTVLG